MRASLIHMFNPVTLLAFATLDLDLRNTIADLRLITGITLRHTVCKNTMCNLIRILVVIPE